ncbi:hypothetical protein N6H18_07775 [Reichenbachiella agarivorans]|uniref:Uncharacterized protein n=1 Tax=Reichenbachiella agarivorans TaxID=2979464 RepID=A0ABY6CTL9_9BACT|nr:hypothetical protein [Reichenbachiella agarivorans]UXP33843.1 hypothetical protein N6H18_07775 [Reichenbachiella agarivorans]
MGKQHNRKQTTNMSIHLTQLAISLLPEALGLLKKLSNKKSALSSAEIEQLFEKQFEFNQKTSAVIEQITKENTRLKGLLLFTTIVALLAVALAITSMVN